MGLAYQWGTGRSGRSLHWRTPLAIGLQLKEWLVLLTKTLPSIVYCVDMEVIFLS